MAWGEEVLPEGAIEFLEACDETFRVCVHCLELCAVYSQFAHVEHEVLAVGRSLSCLKHHQVPRHDRVSFTDRLVGWADLKIGVLRSCHGEAHLTCSRLLGRQLAESEEKLRLMMSQQNLGLESDV
jgi:hypothetical protein